MGTQVDERQPPVWRQLGRHGRTLVAAALVGGVLGGVVALRTPATYEATRVIVSSDPEAVPETFGRLVETVATTDTVLEPVISRLGLSLSTRELLESEMLKVEPVTNAAVIRMVARSTDPRLAFDLARLSADSFVSVARERGLGNFEIFGNDVLPTDAERPSVVTFALLGMGVGGLIVFLVVLLASFFRDPVVSEREAGAEIGAAESYAIRMSSRPIPFSRGSWEVRPAGVLAALWRALGRASGSPPGGALLTCLLIERRRSGDPWLVPLVKQLVDAARETDQIRVRKVVVYRWPLPDDDEEMLASLEGSDAVLVLASEGARRSHLADLAEILPTKLVPVVALVTPSGFRLRALPSTLARRRDAASDPESSAPAETEEAPPPVRTRPRPPEEGGNGGVSGNGWTPRGAPDTPSPAPGGGLASGLDHPSPDVRLEVLEEIGNDPGPEALELVIVRLTDPDPRVRAAAVSVLGRIEDDRAAEALVAAVWSGDSAVRAEARKEIGRRESPAVAARLVEQLGHSKERFVEAGSLLIEMGAVGRATLRAALPGADGIGQRAIRALLESMETGAAPGLPVREPGEEPDPGGEDAGGT